MDFCSAVQCSAVQCSAVFSSPSPPYSSALTFTWFLFGDFLLGPSMTTPGFLFCLSVMSLGQGVPSSFSYISNSLPNYPVPNSKTQKALRGLSCGSPVVAISSHFSHRYQQLSPKHVLVLYICTLQPCCCTLLYTPLCIAIKCTVQCCTLNSTVEAALTVPMVAVPQAPRGALAPPAPRPSRVWGAMHCIAGRGKHTIVELGQHSIMVRLSPGVITIRQRCLISAVWTLRPCWPSFIALTSGFSWLRDEVVTKHAPARGLARIKISVVEPSPVWDLGQGSLPSRIIPYSIQDLLHSNSCRSNVCKKWVQRLHRLAVVVVGVAHGGKTPLLYRCSAACSRPRAPFSQPLLPYRRKFNARTTGGCSGERERRLPSWHNRRRSDGKAKNLPVAAGGR